MQSLRCHNVTLINMALPVIFASSRGGDELPVILRALISKYPRFVQERVFPGADTRSEKNYLFGEAAGECIDRFRSGLECATREVDGAEGGDRLFRRCVTSTHLATAWWCSEPQEFQLDLPVPSGEDDRSALPQELQGLPAFAAGMPPPVLLHVGISRIVGVNMGIRSGWPVEQQPEPHSVPPSGSYTQAILSHLGGAPLYVSASISSDERSSGGAASRSTAAPLCLLSTYWKHASRFHHLVGDHPHQATRPTGMLLDASRTPLPYRPVRVYASPMITAHAFGDDSPALVFRQLFKTVYSPLRVLANMQPDQLFQLCTSVSQLCDDFKARSRESGTVTLPERNTVLTCELALLIADCLDRTTTRQTTFSMATEGSHLASLKTSYKSTREFIAACDAPSASAFYEPGGEGASRTDGGADLAYLLLLRSDPGIIEAARELERCAYPVLDKDRRLRLHFRVPGSTYRAMEAQGLALDQSYGPCLTCEVYTSMVFCNVPSTSMRA